MPEAIDATPVAGRRREELSGRPATKRDIADTVSDAAERMQRFDQTIQLRDGTPVRMRPIRADDAPRLVALYDHLSRDTRYGRFFSVMQRLPPDWARFHADVDYESRLALVVESPDDSDTLIAVARYEPAGEPGAAEVAFVVQDGWQDRGLGTVLFSKLLAAARTEWHPAVPRLGARRQSAHARSHRSAG